MLTGLAKRIRAQADARSIGSPEDIKAFGEWLKARDGGVTAGWDRVAMFDLTGKCALVTGASGGIGEAIAVALHAQGATVALSGTRREKLEEVAASIGSRVHVLPCDLRDRAQVAGLVAQAEAAMGQLDILVNNAGVTKDNLFMRMKDEEWDEVIAINLTSVFILCRGALKKYDAPPLGTHYQHRIDQRRDRQSGTGQLCRLQSRTCRHDEIAGAGGCIARHNRQLYCAGIHRNADDACIE